MAAVGPYTRVHGSGAPVLARLRRPLGRTAHPPEAPRVQAAPVRAPGVRQRRGPPPATSSSAWPPPSGCSASSASARASPATSPPATPSCTDHFWVNPFAVDFSLIKASDLILVNHDGEVVEGDYAVNAAAFAIHSQVHAARPDVHAAAHAHSINGKAFSSLGRLLDPLTQDVCAFYGDHAVFDDYTGVVLDTEEGKRIAHALGDNKAAILRNHGLLTVGALGRRGRVVVHHHGALVPGPAAGHGGRRPGARSTPTWRP